MIQPQKRTVTIEKFQVICSIGIHPEEKQQKQSVLVSIKAGLALDTEPKNDAVAETIDYDEISRIIERIAKQQHFNLQETLARCLFDEIAALEPIEKLTVKTEKPDAYPNAQTIAYEISSD